MAEFSAADISERKEVIDAVCAVTTDGQALKIAEWVKMTPGGHAAAHLDRYLSGKGGTEKVNLEAVLREDFGVRQKVTSSIMAALRAGKTSGSVPIPQDVYRNQDWQFAIGGMNIQWEALAPQVTAGGAYQPGLVRVWFKNLYQWHPSEPRVTQCLHQAAVRMQKAGAQNFLMTGEATVPIH